MTATVQVARPAFTARDPSQRSLPPTGTDAPAKRRLPFRLSSGLAAIGAVGAALALTLYPDLPWNASPSMPSPQPVLPLSADATPAFANPVDWSLIEASADPGPMAIAAYGP